DLTLWSHVLEVSKGNWVAESMVGSILQKQGDREDAMRHYHAALAIYPMDWRSNLAIAVDEQNRGNLPEAIRRYKLAVVNMESPLQQAEAYQNLAVAYRDFGDLTDAMDCRRKAEQLSGQP
ncbi:MAG: tetratricopeptide repeat protein, partial [Candidatus Korobacteraceae bacterium]